MASASTVSNDSQDDELSGIFELEEKVQDDAPALAASASHSGPHDAPGFSAGSLALATGGADTHLLDLHNVLRALAKKLETAEEAHSALLNDKDADHSSAQVNTRLKNFKDECLRNEQKFDAQQDASDFNSDLIAAATCGADLHLLDKTCFALSQRSSRLLKKHTRRC